MPLGRENCGQSRKNRKNLPLSAGRIKKVVYLLGEGIRKEQTGGYDETIGIRSRLAAYTEQLRLAERREATIRQYERALAYFFRWLGSRPLDQQAVIAYQEALSRQYCAGSVNTRLAPLNGFLDFTGRGALRVRQLRIQKKPGNKGRGS